MSIYFFSSSLLLRKVLLFCFMWNFYFYKWSSWGIRLLISQNLWVKRYVCFCQFISKLQNYIQNGCTNSQIHRYIGIPIFPEFLHIDHSCLLLSLQICWMWGKTWVLIRISPIISDLEYSFHMVVNCLQFFFWELFVYSLWLFFY